MSFNVYWVIAGDLWFVHRRSSGRFRCASVGAYEGVIGAGILGGHVLGFAKEGDIDILGILVPELVRGEHESMICWVEDGLNIGSHDCCISAVSKALGTDS